MASDCSLKGRSKDTDESEDGSRIAGVSEFQRDRKGVT